jgi:hypothetical protein
MYDENGNKIKLGDRVVAVKTIAKKTRIYEGTVRGFSAYRPQVLVHVINGGGNHWFNVSQTAVQLTEEA